MALGQLVDVLDAAAFLVDHGGELPALHLKDDGKQLDAPLVALPDEIRVVHVAEHALPRVDRAKGLMVQKGQADAAAAQAGPDQHRGAQALQVVGHVQAAHGQAGVLAVIALVPAVKIDAALHILSPSRCIGRTKRLSLRFSIGAAGGSVKARSGEPAPCTGAIPARGRGGGSRVTGLATPYKKYASLEDSGKARAAMPALRVSGRPWRRAFCRGNLSALRASASPCG